MDVGLYHRSGPRIDRLVPTTTTVTASVSDAGFVDAEVPMPSRLPDDLRSATPAITGDCLAESIDSQSLRIIFGILDEAANGNDSATFLIPSAALTGTFDVRVGEELVVAMNGVACTTVGLFDDAARDRSGNVQVRVGGTEQPRECSVEGSEIQFFLDGRLLFERRTFLAGVTQPLANLAPEAAPNTGPPGAPDTGLGDFATSDGAPHWEWRLGLALLLLAVGAGAIAVVRRR